MLTKGTPGVLHGMCSYLLQMKRGSMGLGGSYKGCCGGRLAFDWRWCADHGRLALSTTAAPNPSRAPITAHRTMRARSSTPTPSVPALTTLALALSTPS